MQRRQCAHRTPDHMRLVDLQRIQHRADVVAGARLRIHGHVLRHVGGRPAARIEGDASVAPREIAHLRLPAAVVAGKLVHEHDRHAAAGFLVVELHAVVGGEMGHRCYRSRDFGSKGVADQPPPIYPAQSGGGRRPPANALHAKRARIRTGRPTVTCGQLAAACATAWHSALVGLRSARATASAYRGDASCGTGVPSVRLGWPHTAERCSAN